MEAPDNRALAQLSSALDQAIPEQPGVRSLIKQIISGQHLSHAYLFLGPVGAAKTKTAQAFASAILCDYDTVAGRQNSRLSAVDERIRVAHHTHPDLRDIHPEGAQGYLIGQIRELVDDVQVKPKRSNHKVYIVHRADTLNQESANALLKTVEEPPDYVTIILIARHRESVLPTIYSRCQVINFPPITPDFAEGMVVDRSGCSRAAARQALSVCNMSASDAISFVRDINRQQVRTKALMLCTRLAHAPSHEILSLTRDLIALAKLPCEEMESAQAQEIDKQEQALSKKLITQMKAQHKRELSAKQRACIMEILAIIRSYLHDVLKASQLTDAQLVNVDVATSILATAEKVGVHQLQQCFDALKNAELHLRSNVSPQLTLEALFFELKEVLLCRPS